MTQTRYSHKSRDDTLRRRQAANYYRNIGRLWQAYLYAKQRRAPPVPPRPDDSKIIEGTFFVVGSETDGIYQPGIKRIKTLRYAVFRKDKRIMGVWTLAIICAFFGSYWLALDLFVLAVLLFYLKFVRAAKAKCPNCQKNFGSSQRLPTRLGSDSCQHCGLSITAIR